MKINTLSKSMFSCWLLFVAEAAFPFFEFCCGGLSICVWSIFAVSVVTFCVVFNLLISSSGSFIFCCYLSSLALLVLEKVRDRLFPCFRCLLVGLIDRSLLWMLGLVFLSKLVVKFCLLEGFRLFSIFQRMLAFLCCQFFR